jgi:hypothetical protein
MNLMVGNQMKEKLSFKIPRRSDNRLTANAISDEMFNEICLLTPWVEDTSRKSLKERVYCIENNITEVPHCLECNNKVKFRTEYFEHCSKTCSNRSNKNKDSKVKSSVNKWNEYVKSGSELGLSFLIPRDIKNRVMTNAFSDEMFNEICSLTPYVEDTSRKSLGERIYCLSNNIIEIPKCLECNNKVKFGTRYFEYCGQTCSVKSQKTQDAMKETCFKHFGVTHQSKSPSIILLKKENYFNKTGYYHQWQNPEILKVIIETNLKRYGVENPMQSEEIQEKMSISLANNFQARRNEEGTDYSGVVYILHFPQHSAVKIGLTGDFEKRSVSLLKDFGEFSVIDIIETQECFKLETSLHEKFSEYRFCLEEGCGRTEFFSDEILENFK